MIDFTGWHTMIASLSSSRYAKRRVEKKFDNLNYPQRYYLNQDVKVFGYSEWYWGRLVIQSKRP